MRIIILLAFFLCTNVFSQVGINTTNPEPSSILDINSTNKGVLIPRVEITNLYDSSSPVYNPAHGLMVFNTLNLPGQEEGFYYWNGSRWAKVGSQNLIFSKSSKNFSAPIQIDSGINYNTISGMEIDFIAHSSSVLLILSSSGRSSGNKTIGEVFFRVLKTKINDIDISPIVLGGTSTNISSFYDDDPYLISSTSTIFSSRRWSCSFSVLLENLQIGNKYRLEIEGKSIISLGVPFVQILHDSHIFNTDKTDHITISIIH
jgi:hypothetical protein